MFKTPFVNCAAAQIFVEWMNQFLLQICARFRYPQPVDLTDLTLMFIDGVHWCTTIYSFQQPQFPRVTSFGDIRSSGKHEIIWILVPALPLDNLAQVISTLGLSFPIWKNKQTNKQTNSSNDYIILDWLCRSTSIVHLKSNRRDLLHGKVQ